MTPVNITTWPPPFCEERVNYAAEMYALLGDGAAMSGRHADAEQRYRAALSFEPRSTRIRAHLGVALAELGRFDEAADQLGMVIERAADPRLRFCAIHAELEILAQTGSTQDPFDYACRTTRI